MKSFWILLFSLYLIFPVSISADQSDPRLDDLFQQLRSSGDQFESIDLESKIWQVWIENDNPEFYRLMLSGIQKMNRNSLTAALRDFDRLVEIAPNYAEAWNKRATIHYLLNDLKASEADISTTLMLEPFHFGALSGLGLVYIAQGDFLKARNVFNSALEIHPYMQGVKNNLEFLANRLRINAI